VAVYDLERLNILVVEDNSFVRGIFEQLLRGFHVGFVGTAKNGADAVESLKHAQLFSQMRGPMEVDLVISDLIMAPVDGLLLLRWIRGSKESPNRFLPFIMLSGAADAGYVASARDLGASEFLAKPFSAESVYKHLLEIIDHPRPFIATQTYFGPDRRRRQGVPPGKERRLTMDKDITVVYSADRIVKSVRPSEVWRFHLPNRLRDKVGGLGNDEPGELPLNLLAEAEAQLERTSVEFTDWAKGYLAKLAKLCEEALAQPSGRRKQFEQINLLAHELRGQGGTFGYPLISVFGKMLYDVTGSSCSETDGSVETVKAHVDAMRAVIREKISGDGGAVGRELLLSLKEAVKKFAGAA